MKKIKSTLMNLLKDESGQGMTEYILLIMVVVAIGFLFKEKIMDAVNAKMGEVSGKIGSFNP